MKVTQEHFEILKAAVSPLDTEELRKRYLAGDFPRANLVQDLDMRYRWDLLWASGARPTFGSDITSAHIDTALRKIVPPLEGN